MGRIGFDNVEGYLEGSILALDGQEDLLRATERRTPDVMADEMASPEPPFVLDVRTAREWRAKRIDGSVNLPLNHLLARVGELPCQRRMWVYCAGGYRSSIAASVLQRAGFDRVAELAGGFAAWEAAKLPAAAYVPVT